MKLPRWRLDELPVPAFICRRDGRLLASNALAPALLGTFGLTGGQSPFDQMRWDDGPEGRPGRAMLTAALAEPLRNQRIRVRRPDGTHYAILMGMQPIRGRRGGAVAVLCCPTALGEDASVGMMMARYAAIVQNSDDAILSKNLDGIITSWNRGAERIFGYTADETIGQPITMLIPEGRQDEEQQILARLRRGERIDHYETIRRRKDGRHIHISLTVSPVRAPDGTIVGASKIARDITEQQMARERQELLMREINHRVNNVFAITNAIVSLSAPFAASAPDLARAIRQRLDALSRAQRLSRPGLGGEGTLSPAPTALDELIRTIVSPYEEDAAGAERVVLRGPPVTVAGTAVANLALVIHELATNAAKYGALSVGGGRITVTWHAAGPDLVLLWRESGGPAVTAAPLAEGFGRLLTQRIVVDQFGGALDLQWPPGGLEAALRIPAAKLAK